MTALNIFTAIGDFFTNVLFVPFNEIRLGGMGWLGQNFINWIFIAIGFVLFAYWMKESASFKKNNTEDLA
ncbi:MAG: DUF6341 family protein [Flavobacteriaceae bacterium]|nr:hypothetical protein [Flavobacteriaceae bacterium]